MLLPPDTGRYWFLVAHPDSVKSKEAEVRVEGVPGSLHPLPFSPVKSSPTPGPWREREKTGEQEMCVSGVEKTWCLRPLTFSALSKLGCRNHYLGDAGRKIRIPTYVYVFKPKEAQQITLY